MFSKLACIPDAMVENPDTRSTPFSRRFSRALADLEAEGISQATLATQLGFSENTISSWKQGHHQPRLKNLKAIAAALEVPLQEFVADEAPPSRKATPSAEELADDLADLDLLGPLEALVGQKRSLLQLARKSDDLIALLRAAERRRDD
jgi:transcriptional regulator with XRE-family HTH domain